MKTLLAIATHSFVDIITNSSTEMFACDGSNTIEFIKDYLNSRVPEASYIEPWIFSIEEYRKFRKDYEKAYKEYNKKYTETGVWDENIVKPFWNNPYEEIDGYFIDEECEEDLEKLRTFHIRYKVYKEHFKELSDKIEEELLKTYTRDTIPWEKLAYRLFEEETRIYEELVALPDNEKPEWWSDMSIIRRHYIPVKELEGKIIITSSDSICFYYDEYETVEKDLNATKYHLG